MFTHEKRSRLSLGRNLISKMKGMLTIKQRIKMKQGYVLLDLTETSIEIQRRNVPERKM